MENNVTNRRIVLMCCAITLGFYHIMASHQMYPLPGGDAVTFVPPAINLKAGRGLTNPLWSLPGSQEGDRFLWHPPLFQLVLSTCMWRPDTQNAFMVLAIFNALTLWVYTALLCRARFAASFLESVTGFCFLLSSMFAVSFFVFRSSEGRPEALSSLVLVFAIVLLVWLPAKYQRWILGVTTGVAGAIHPTHGIFFAALVAIIFSVRSRTIISAALDATLAALVAVTVFWLLMSIGPNGVLETLRSISAHGAAANGADYQLSSFLAYYWKLSPWNGIYLIAFVAVFGWFGAYLRRTAPDRTACMVRLATLLVAGFAFWYFSIRSPNKAFYLVMLSPALVVGAIYLLQVSQQWCSPKHAVVALRIATGFCLVFSIFLARDAAGFVNYMRHGVSFSDARAEYENLEKLGVKPIFVSEALWVLTEHFERIKIVIRGTAAGDMMVIQQSQRRTLSPAPISGYHLELNHFVPYPPSVLGVPIGRTMPGYAFAVFTKISGESQ